MEVVVEAGVVEVGAAPPAAGASPSPSGIP